MIGAGNTKTLVETKMEMIVVVLFRRIHVSTVFSRKIHVSTNGP
jgi:hypothetical protein